MLCGSDCPVHLRFNFIVAPRPVDGYAQRGVSTSMTHRIDFILFALYLLLNMALGIWVARRRTGGTRDYFLAGEGLPWYTIGGSIIAANISTEHFIGMIGVGYALRVVGGGGGWGDSVHV